jgi:hypothetical protein
MTNPEKKEEALLSLVTIEEVEIDELDDEEPSPATLRSDRVYQRLVQSERPTVPPPAQSHIRDLLGRAVVSEDDEDAEDEDAVARG